MKQFPPASQKAASQQPCGFRGCPWHLHCRIIMCCEWFPCCLCRLHCVLCDFCVARGFELCVWFLNHFRVSRGLGFPCCVVHDVHIVSILCCLCFKQPMVVPAVLTLPSSTCGACLLPVAGQYPDHYVFVFAAGVSMISVLCVLEKMVDLLLTAVRFAI